MGMIIITLLTYAFQLAFLFVIYGLTNRIVSAISSGKNIVIHRHTVVAGLVAIAFICFVVVSRIINAKITYDNENLFLYLALATTVTVAFYKSLLSINKTTRAIDFYIINLFFYTQPVMYYIFIFNCPWDLNF
jgi:hypothetical protein